MEQVKYIEFLLSLRKDVGIADTNPYVFGTKDTRPSEFNCLDACKWMREFLNQCGAENLFSLRGTELRKHVATMGTILNLDEQKVLELAKFLGHRKDIHKEIYRRPIESQEILTMSEVLEAARGGRKGVDDPQAYKNLNMFNNVINNDINETVDFNIENLSIDHDHSYDITTEEKSKTVNQIVNLSPTDNLETISNRKKMRFTKDQDENQVLKLFKKI
ncbi:uncharacterized protein LOC122506369 [Leptopilina heterotoma]|uniref:uncharacterized protein LOC122506369 n=1 Tax=Leptopilina heterotoma TaxID=63436 RepID=UPI001CA9BC1C|nr:uncharacterized protein LOC122506369 [Leptopilina heterotoma]